MGELAYRRSVSQPKRDSFLLPLRPRSYTKSKRIGMNLGAVHANVIAFGAWIANRESSTRAKAGQQGLTKTAGNFHRSADDFAPLYIKRTVEPTNANSRRSQADRSSPRGRHGCILQTTHHQRCGWLTRVVSCWSGHLDQFKIAAVPNLREQGDGQRLPGPLAHRECRRL